MAILFSAGNQLPAIPLVDVVGNADKFSPWHIGATDVKIGATGESTVKVNVVGFAHCPAFGVKV